MPQRTCSIEGCLRKHSGRGWCSAHYALWRRYGTTDPHVYVPERIPVELRFWDKVDRREPDACWLWVGARRHRYGEVWRDNKHVYAHRVSYEIANGPIPAGLFICHRCDTPLCVNPAHLFAGTQTDNMRDAANKGRVRGVFGSPENPIRKRPPGTHCVNGHEWADNIRFRKNKGGNPSRFCVVCQKEANERYKARKRAS